jgi:transcriptional regulator GlxA family with amidase domain
MRRVVFAVVPPIQILDLTGPFEVFARCGGYRVEVVTSASDQEVQSSSGLTITGAKRFRGIRGSIDTLLVPGGAGAEQLLCEASFLRWLANTSSKVRRTGSICTGAFLLGAARILDGRSATTHWAWCERLAQQFPRTSVNADSIFVKDEHVYTSAGVSAGIDLALSLVQEDHGRDKARAIARDLVMYLHRAGGQTQFSSFLTKPEPSRRSIEKLQQWIPDHLTEDLSVRTLAQRCAMSPRNFARVFAAETGITPARFVEQMRISAARILLEDSIHGMEAVSARCGFRSADTMRRAFLRSMAITPAQYQKLHGTRSRPGGGG